MTTSANEHKGLGLGTAMLHGLARNWWLLLLRGIAAIVFGILAFAVPGLTLVTLVILYGAYALADGIFAIGAAVMGGGATGSRWWMAVVGVLGIAAGILTFVWPGITALVLLYFIAFWSIAIGIFEVVGAIQLRKQIDNEWLLIIRGVISILFGFFLLARPGEGALALIWVIGAYAIIAGVIFVALAFRLRKHKHAAA